MQPRRLLTAAEAADFLRFPTIGAFHDFLYRRHRQNRPVRTLHRGGVLLFTETDLEAALDVEEAAPRKRERK